MPTDRPGYEKDLARQRKRWAEDPDFRLRKNMQRYLFELRQGMEAKQSKLNQLIGEVHEEEN